MQSILNNWNVAHFPAGTRVQLNETWGKHTDGKGQGPWRVGTKAVVVGVAGQDLKPATNRLDYLMMPPGVVVCLEGGFTNTSFNPIFLDIVS